MIQSFIFGITIAIAIGPIALLIIGISLSDGVSKGMRCGIGAATADLTYALLAFYGGQFISNQIAGNENTINIVSSVILLLLGIKMLVMAIKNYGQPKSPAIFAARPFTTTYLLTLSNPLTLIAFAGFIGSLHSSEIQINNNPLVLALSLFLGSLLVQLTLAISAGILQSIIRNVKIISMMNIAGSLGIMIFGIMGFVKY